MKANKTFTRIVLVIFIPIDLLAMFNVWLVNEQTLCDTYRQYFKDLKRQLSP